MDCNCFVELTCEPASRPKLETPCIATSFANVSLHSGSRSGGKAPVSAIGHHR